MPDPNEFVSLRRRKIGVLLRNAREVFSLSPADCALRAGVSSEQWLAFENGTASPSQAQLTSFAQSLNLPWTHFQGNMLLDPGSAGSGAQQLQDSQRHSQQIAGRVLRGLREERGLSLPQVAESCGTQMEVIEGYEAGEPIPAAQLPLLAHVYSLLDDDLRILLAQAEAEQALDEHSTLPADLRAFAADPANRRFLEAARQLSLTPRADLDRILLWLQQLTRE